jgi:hypothetical protein
MAAAGPAVPGNLLAAKSVAVQRFLRNVQPSPMFAAAATASRPEHNVVGVGIGHKIANGGRLDHQCVRFYVEHKIRKESIPKEFLLPERIEGIATDVIESGRFYAYPPAEPLAARGMTSYKPPMELRGRMRPAPPGCSVGFQFPGERAGLMAGTFGAVVAGGGKWHILSNNHVLACENKMAPGCPIFQPGLLDDGKPDRDQIAKLTRFVAVNQNTTNSVDCAIAELLAHDSVTAELHGIGHLASGQPIPAVENMRVEKAGRTTGLTKGQVFDIFADIPVQYDMGVVMFRNQILITTEAGKFCDHGDSGSLVVDSESRRATGLFFAASRYGYGIANDLSDVLAQLNVTLVT